MNLDQIARRYHAFESVDADEFQRRARILQSMWREDNGWEPAEYRGKIRGARLQMPFARDTLANYLDETIRQVVRCEVLNEEKSRGKLYGKPRIFNNLLSSQPLCFNLFAHLQRDTELATEVIRAVSGGRVDRVTNVEFEYSPGRGDEQYTGDRSAFDVFVETTTVDGGRGFVGIEVKYHENLKTGREEPTPRCRELAAEIDCFVDDAVQQLADSELIQIWRDHLLAGSMLSVDDWDDGFFVFLSPRDNAFCRRAFEEYRSLLTDDATFAAWSLEEVVEALESTTDSPWVEAFRRRYLDFDRLEERLVRSGD